MFGENLVPLCLLSVLELPTETFYWGTTSLCWKLVYKSSGFNEIERSVNGFTFFLHFDHFCVEWNVCFEKDISYVWDIYRYICMRLYEDKFVWDI